MTLPLVAAVRDSTTWNTGIGIVEDAYQVSDGIQNHSWVDATLGAVGGGLDLLSAATDPLGALAGWGVAWLLEHVHPLREALDRLAGNADEVNSHAGTWKNVGESLKHAQDRYTTRMRNEISDWLGSSGDAYRQQAATHLALLDGMSTAAKGISYAIEGAGMLVGMVRGFVRDLISQFVATLAVRQPEWLAEEGVTLGLATPVVAAQVATLVASWAAKIQRFIRALINSLRRLTPMVHHLGEIFTKLQQLFAKLRKMGGAGPGYHPEPGSDRPPREHASADESGAEVPKDRALTEGDQASLHDYTTNDGYTTMNPFLRDPSKYSQEDREIIQARRQCFRRAGKTPTRSRRDLSRSEIPRRGASSIRAGIVRYGGCLHEHLRRSCGSYGSF